MKKWLLAGMLCLGMSSVIFAQDTAKVKDSVIVPVNYVGKIYVNGYCDDISSLEYKVYTQNNTVYLPLRLIVQLIRTSTEYWEGLWDSNNPDELILRCTYMEPLGDDAYVAADKQSAIVLRVGSKEVKVDKKPMLLSSAPTRIDGMMVLPLRSVGELLGKQVSYQDGLVILSDGQIDKDNVDEIATLQKIKTRLESKEQTQQVEEEEFDADR